MPSAIACGTTLSFDYFRSHFLSLSAHFLLHGHCGCAGAPRLSLRDAFVCFGLFGLQFRADVIAHVNVGYVDGENFERRIAVEPFGQNCLGKCDRILQHFLCRNVPNQIALTMPSPTRAMIVSRLHHRQSDPDVNAR